MLHTIVRKVWENQYGTLSQYHKGCFLVKTRQAFTGMYDHNFLYLLKNMQRNIVEKQANVNTEKTTRNSVNCNKQDSVKRSLSTNLSLQSPVFLISLASGSPSSLCLLFGTMFIILSKASYHPQVLDL